ncbi:MAG TPA: hypothetical protein VM370_05990 [Candidatus Thermoplasmatota archaeon]|nr:hypothetical protein [Candidatus Thermoplasmatota archaeon]
MRALTDPHVEFTQDHILVSLDRWTKLATVSGSFAIPYSTVRDAAVELPRIPGLTEQWFHGLHVPGVVAKGRFLGWKGERRFLWIERNTTRALHLKLIGHPNYDEVVLGTSDADAMLKRLEAARKGLS